MLQPLKETFKAEDYPELLVGLARADDAAVYQLNPEQAIVTTTDFFPPVVDDPYDFGAIAAANALSDIYAMGARPIFAMNLVAFPDGLDMSILREILRGGAEKVAEAGAVIAGGHSVADKEPKYGLAVTGVIHPDDVKTKGGSRPGDVLLLTKPLGAGLVTTALKQEKATESDVRTAVESMKRLNQQAAEADRLAGATSMTDVTGFGLLGHAHEMAHLGMVNFQIEAAKLPWLPGAPDYGKAGAFPGGTWRNLDFFTNWVEFDDSVSEIFRNMLWTPETSGGLLVSVTPEKVADFMANCETAVEIGVVQSGDGHLIIL